MLNPIGLKGSGNSFLAPAILHEMQTNITIPSLASGLHSRSISVPLNFGEPKCLRSRRIIDRL